MRVLVQKVREGARLPSRAHEDDAGYDLYACARTVLAPGSRASIATGIALALPEGYAALVWDKSGLSHRHGLKTLGGVIDAGYRGEICVGVVNLGEAPYTVEKGDKIAQLLLQKVESAEWEEVAALPESARGARGFGSTGKR